MEKFYCICFPYGSIDRIEKMQHSHYFQSETDPLAFSSLYFPPSAPMASIQPNRSFYKVKVFLKKGKVTPESMDTAYLHFSFMID